MKKLLTLLIFIFSCALMHAQVPQWLTKIGSSGSDFSTQTKVCRNGNVILVGNYVGTIDLDPSSATYNITSYNSTQDMFLACYTQAGTFLWGFSLGKDDYDGIMAVDVDTANNIYIGGFFRGTNVDFDPSSSSALFTCLGSTGAGSNSYGGDGFVAKYSSTGAYQWFLQLGTPYWIEVVESVHIDRDGNLLCGGQFKDQLDFDPSPTSATILNGNTSGTAFLAKYTSNKQFLWAFNFGKSGIAAIDNGVRGIKTDSANNIYISGFVQYATNIDFDPSPTSTVNLVPNGNYDAFVAKYTPAGAYIFAFLIGGPGVDDFMNLDLDTAYNIYVTGYSDATSIDFDPSSSTAISSLSGAGGNNIIMAKYTSSGVYQWGKLIGGSGSDNGRRIKVNKNYLLVTGSFSNTVNFNPSASPTASMTSAGNTDIYVAKYKLNGTYDCSFRVGSTSADEGYGIAFDTSGYFYLTGTFSGTSTDFDPGVNTLAASSAGSTDIFLVKYKYDDKISGYLIGDTICAGEPAYLTYVDTTGASSVVINYTDGTNFYTKSVSSGVPFALSPNPAITTSYSLLSSSVNCGPATGNTVKVFVNPVPVANAGNDTAVCPIASVQLHGSGGVSYSWYAASAIANSTSQYPTVSGYANGTYYLVATNSYLCKDTDDVVVTINPVPIANAGNDTTVCATPSVQLHASGGNAYSWFSTSSITNASSQNPTVSGIAGGTYYVVAVNAFSCKDTDDIIVSVNPLPVANAGNDTAFCSSSTIQLHGSGGGNYLWNSSSSITNPTSSNPTVSGTAGGTYYLKVTNGFNCSDTDTVAVTVYPLPIANAGRDTIICPAPFYQLKATGGNIYSWYSAASITNPASATPLVSGTTPGIYYVIAINSFYCRDTDDIAITIAPLPVANAGNDTFLCPSADIQLKGTGGKNYYWYSTLPLSNPVVANPSVSGSLPGTYYLVVDNTYGCKDTDDVNVIIKAVPVADAGKDTIVCPGASIKLNASGGGTYHWLSSSSIPNPFSQHPVISVDKGAIYYVVVSNGSCDDTASVSVAIVPLPEFSIRPGKADLCRGGILTITAEGGDSYQWQPDTGIIIIAPNSIQVMPDSNTKYKVIIKENKCNYTDTLSSYVTVNPIPVLMLGKTNDISCSKGSAILSASGAGRYEWLPGGELIEPNEGKIKVAPKQGTVYHVTGISTEGCKDTSSIYVDVKSEGAVSISIPTAFSPNNDGKNDCYQLFSNSIFVSYSFSIYNRWGQAVFQSGNINDCWNGVYKGQVAELGTYNFMLKASTEGCQNLFEKGTIELVR